MLFSLVEAQEPGIGVEGGDPKGKLDAFSHSHPILFFFLVYACLAIYLLFFSFSFFLFFISSFVCLFVFVYKTHCSLYILVMSAYHC